MYKLDHTDATNTVLSLRVSLLFMQVRTLEGTCWDSSSPLLSVKPTETGFVMEMAVPNGIILRDCPPYDTLFEH